MNLFRMQGKSAGSILAIAALALTAGPGRAQGTLTMNGRVVSTGVRSLGGGVYVRLSDMAKALGMVVVKRPGGYDLQKPGGANQVQGVTQGKVGDHLFDGQWRFQALSVQTPESYTAKTSSFGPSSYPADTIEYDNATRLLRAKSGYKIVAIQCRMTNGQKESHTFWFGSTSDVKNAITETQGESYSPVGYDVEGQNYSKRLLPGAGTTFSILFSVPEATQIKDLIFTLRNNEFPTSKVSDVRVSLTP